MTTEVLLVTLLAGIVGLSPVSALAARTWYVDDVTDPLEDGTAAHPYDSIQQAINAAANGDTVIVNPGTYFENIIFNGKAVTVRSTNPTNEGTVRSTIIDGGGTAPVVRVIGGEGNGTKIMGFTITHGQGDNNISTSGGGVSCSGASPEISHNIIVSNNATYQGAGITIYSDNGTVPIIKDNQILYNHGYWGGGLYYNFGAGDVVLENNVFAKNTAQSGAGAYIDHPQGKFILTHCTVVSNNAAVDTDGIYFTGRTPGTVEVWNSIAWGNNYDIVGVNVAAYCDVQRSVAGTGNISQDPKFRSVQGDNYRLATNSPCIDTATSTNASTEDIEGKPRPRDGNADGTPGYDMGAYEYAPDSFGPVTGNVATAVEYFFVSTPGAFHQVQYSTDLLSSNWFNFGAPISGDGTEKSVFDSTRGTTAKFYRVLSY